MTFLKLNGNDIKVAYLTNGDYSIPAEIRAKEAIHAIRTLGLNEDDVFFFRLSRYPIWREYIVDRDNG